MPSSYFDAPTLAALDGTGAPSPMGMLAKTVLLGTLLNALAPLAPQDIADPGDAGAIGGLQSGTVRLVSGAGGETRTVDAPEYPGLRLALFFQTDGGGNVAVTFPADFNGAGNNVITHDTAGEVAVFESLYTASGTLAWRLVANPESVPVSG